MIQELTIEDLEYTISELDKLTREDEPLATNLNKHLIRTLSNIMEVKKDKTLSNGDSKVSIYLNIFFVIIRLLIYICNRIFLFDNAGYADLHFMYNQDNEIVRKIRVLMDSKEPLIQKFQKVFSNFVFELRPIKMNKSTVGLIRQGRIQEIYNDMLEEKIQQFYNDMLKCFASHFYTIIEKTSPPEKFETMYSMFSIENLER